jgi:hypothetical protein
MTGYWGGYQSGRVGEKSVVVVLEIVAVAVEHCGTTFFALRAVSLRTK